MDRRSPHHLAPLFLTAGLAVLLALLSGGCGTVEEATGEDEDTWTQPTDLPPDPPQQTDLPPGAAAAPEPVAPPEMLLLQYRVDSLMGENRRLRQQVDAMAAEIRSLSSRNSELEARVRETPPQKPPAVAMTAPAPTRAPSRKQATTAPTPEGSDAYSDALATCRRRDFSEAVTQFEALLNSGKAGTLAPNCHYWLGESYYGMGRYADAIASFESVLEYPASEKKDDAQMMLGNCHLAQKNNAAARAAFSSLISNYPQSPFVRRAREKMAAIN
jgi:tol-pal system protein YbgF